MWFLLVIVILLSIWLYWCYKNRRMIIMARKLPGPPALPVIGNAIMFMVKPEEFIKITKYLMNMYGDVTKVWLGTDLNIIVSNPENVTNILTNNKANVKGPQYKYIADIIGDGLLSGSGSKWRKYRKIITPNFGKHAVENYNDTVYEEVHILLQKLNKIDNGQQINIYKYIVQTTSYIVCQCLMGLTKRETMELPCLQTLIDISPEIYNITFERMTKWYLQIEPVFWLTKYHTRQNEGMRQIRKFTAAVIKHRMDKLKYSEEEINNELCTAKENSMNISKLNIIDRFILSHELDMSELINETFTIFTASQEATAKIASFLLLMLAYHPISQEKLYKEIERVIGKENKPITDEDLKQMPYLEMTFKEVTRLFPIGAMLQRTVTEDIKLKTFTIPAGSSVVIPIYHMQRDPRYWSDPDAFDPERFNLENRKTRNPNIFFPFSLGSMDCIGRYFGTKIVKTIAIRVMQKFKLTTLNKYKDLRIKIAISATTFDGFPVILMPRSNVK